MTLCRSVEEEVCGCFVIAFVCLLLFGAGVFLEWKSTGPMVGTSKSGMTTTSEKAFVTGSHQHLLKAEKEP